MMKYFKIEKNIFTFRRGSRALSYLMFALSGWVSLFTISPIIGDATTPTVGVVWSFFLGLGGTLSLAGVVFDNWFLEYIGLPMVVAAFFVLSLAAFYSSGAGGPVYLSSGFIAAGIAINLLYRIWELFNAIKQSKEV